MACFAQEYLGLRANLESFADQSIEARRAVMPIGNRHGFESYEMDSLNRLINFRDSLHLRYAVSVLAEHGWLGISIIGEKANISLFLAVQYANLQVRERYYPLLEASAQKGESSRSQMAAMKDRMLVDKKLPQRYGTQWNYVGGREVLFPLEDVSSVNNNRIRVGIEPLTTEEIRAAQIKYK